MATTVIMEQYMDYSELSVLYAYLAVPLHIGHISCKWHALLD